MSNRDEVDLSEFDDVLQMSDEILDEEAEQSIVPEGKQNLYLEDVRASDNFQDGIKRIILDIKGAEDSNRDRDATQMFQMVRDPDKMKYLNKFLRKIGFTRPWNGKTLVKDIRDELKGVVFEANVKHQVGTTRTFVNVYPNHPIHEAQAGETTSVSDGESPGVQPF